MSPRPFGVGTKRQAKLFGVPLRVQEEYFIWEEGRRMAFFVTDGRPPAYRRSAEDYAVEPAPVMPLVVKRMFTDTRHHFERLAR